MPRKRIPLEPGRFYHIFNRGNNRENLFREGRNYDYFIGLWEKHVHPVVETYAYCLLKNHFHFLVKIREDAPVKTDDDTARMNPVEQKFSNLFNAYAKAINKGYMRTGKLFEPRFRRKLVDSEAYFDQMVYYIHANPWKHGFIEDFRDYGGSSYYSIVSTEPTFVEKEKVLSKFGGKHQFKLFHQNKWQRLEDEEKFVIE